MKWGWDMDLERGKTIVIGESRIANGENTIESVENKSKDGMTLGYQTRLFDAEVSRQIEARP